MTSKEKKEPYNKNYTMECYIFNSKKQNPHKKITQSSFYLHVKEKDIFYTLLDITKRKNVLL